MQQDARDVESDRRRLCRVGARLDAEYAIDRTIDGEREIGL